jgi:hypothetical protein
MKTTENRKSPVVMLSVVILFLGVLFVLALKEVVGPSRSFLRQFWIGLAATVVLGAGVFVISCRRELWSRLIDADEHIALRLGLPAKRRRRVAESRGFKIFLWVLFGVSALTTVVTAFAYLHFTGL